MKKNQTWISFASAALCLIAPVSSHAENGTMDFLASFVANYAKSEFGDTTVTAGGSSGTITVTKSNGAPFVEGTSGLIQCIVFAKKSPAGMDLEADCPATFSSDDTLLMVSKRKSGDVVAGSSGEGTSQIVGGTGRFAGMSGQCKYKVDYLAGNRVVSINRCQWSR